MRSCNDKRIGGGMTLDQIAAELGLSRSRVQQIEARAIAKLRHNRTVKALARLGFETTDDWEPAPFGYPENARKEPRKRQVDE